MHDHKTQKLLSLLMVIIGNIIYAFTIKFFIIPANLISCGTTGIAMVVTHLTSIPMSAFIFVFNLAMLALGWAVLGRQFAMTTILSSLFYPIALEILNQVFGDFRITENLLMNTIFGGIGLGCSLGIVLRAGASTGGMDIPPLILKKFFHIPISVSLWTFDFCIMLCQMFYHTLEELLYGIVLLMLISFMLNKVLLLGTSRTEVKIISEKHEEIRRAILSDIDRGCTLLHAQGGYGGKETEVILSIVSNYELPRVQQLARDIDPSCFMIISQVSEVWGRGFTYGKQAEPHQE